MSIRRLVSSRTNISLPSETEVWDLSSDQAGQAFDVLSSKTAREALTSLYDEPKTASELAEALGTSLQNVDYHIGNLRDAELVEVATVEYSQTGNEMKVYAPTTNAVLLLSTESMATRIRALMAQLFSGVLLLILGSIAFRSLIVGGVIPVPTVEVSFGEDDDAPTDDDDVAAPDDGDVADDSPDDVEDADAQPGDDSIDRRFHGAEEFVETINPLEHLPWLLDPGVTFFLGSVFGALVLLGLLWIRLR